MKGLMFNNKYGLQDSVLNGTKTMTRRNIRIPNSFNGIWVAGFKKWTNSLGQCFTELYDGDGRSIEGSELKPPCEIGEVVAIKQSYKDIGFEPEKILYRSIHGIDGYRLERADSEKGWNNKMFVCNDLMTHKVKIINIILQRLQDISNEDCFKEGVIKNQIGYYVKGIKPDKIHCSYTIVDDVAYKLFPTPKEAYAALINKVNGKGTWDNNDWVWAIEFELID